MAANVALAAPRRVRVMAFRGFPPEAISFYEGLEADNSKSYWTANKTVYEEAVKAPMEALCADLDADSARCGCSVPYRDVRFSKDKSPYKTAAAAAGESEGGAVYYVQMSSNGLFVGSGCYHMAPDQLARFRAAVDDDRTGAEVEGISLALEKAGFDMAAHDELKTAPRGYAKDHPRIALLKRKGLDRRQRLAGRQVAAHRAGAAARVEAAWRACGPLNDWLAAHVGPSEMRARRALRVRWAQGRDAVGAAHVARHEVLRALDRDVVAEHALEQLELALAQAGARAGGSAMGQWCSTSSTLPSPSGTDSAR